ADEPDRRSAVRRARSKGEIRMIALSPARRAALAGGAALKGRSLWDDARGRLFRNKAAVASLVVLGLLALAAVFGPMVWPHDYDTIYRDRVAIGPTLQNLHLFGTDAQGRDLFVRTL